MKKVIVKCKVGNKEKFTKQLADIEMRFSEVYWLHDRVYVPKNYKSGINLPRLVMRTEMRAVNKSPKYAMILKRHIEDSGVDVVEETMVGDYVAATKMIMQLGFKPMAEVARRRQELKLDDDTVIYLDNLDGNKGYYAKLETKYDEKDSVTAVREDLMATLVALGEKDFISKAYGEIEK